VLGLSAVAAPLAAADDLCALNDEFEDPSTLSQWQRVHLVEQWNADQLEVWDIDMATPGRMTLVPWTVTWYENWRGPLAFKSVAGDFVVTTAARVVGRDGVSLPQAQFSLGGIMVRTPRHLTPATWTPGGENYVFLSIGYGSALPPRFQYEVKTTTASVSTLVLSDAPGPESGLRTARVGDYMIMLRRQPAGPWQVHHRYARADFPDTLQVGLVAYSDWEKAGDFAPFDHNGNVLREPLPPALPDPTPGEPFAPDVRAEFEYVRFATPQLPAHLVGVDLTDSGTVPDSELLAFLGDAVDTVCAPVDVPESATATRARLQLGAARPSPFRAGTSIAFRVESGVPYRLGVYDLAGRRVRELSGGAVAGEASAFWNGRDDTGRAVPSGVYVIRLEGAGTVLARKVTRTR
jgi:hypothetical protein